MRSHIHTTRTARAARLAGLALIGAVLAGCSGTTDATDDGTGAVDDTTSGTATAPDASERPDVETALEAEQVVLAIVMLTAGDIEAALAEGLVSPAEVDAALRAITAGTAQDWFDLAAEQLAGG